MLTRILSQELVEYNISVNELIPGPTRTDMNPHLLGTETFGEDPNEWVKNAEDLIPLALFMADLPAKGPSGQSFSYLRRDVY